MQSNFKLALNKVLKHEGGFVNHPKDPGGATMKGVTLYNYRRYINKNATVRDLKKITKSEIEFVYKKFYWDKCRCDALPSGLDYVVFDFAVNSGPGRSAKFLQRLLGVTADGKIGPVTAEAAQKASERELIRQLCDNRLAWLKTLRHWPTFGKGWSRRVAGVRKDGLTLVGKKGLVLVSTPSDEKAPTTSTVGLVIKIIRLLTKLLSRG